MGAFGARLDDKLEIERPQQIHEGVEPGGLKPALRLRDRALPQPGPPRQLGLGQLLPTPIAAQGRSDLLG